MRMLRSYTIPLISLTLLAPSFSAVADFSFGRSEGAMVGLSKAYGYLLGQDYTLARIAQQYPTLQAPVRSAELNFSITYGSTIMDKLIAEMTDGIGSNKFRQVASRMNASIENQINSTPLSHQVAVDFIAEVNSRARGEVDGSILPYLSAAKYKDQPASEFSAKMRQRFNTEGHPKSLGLNLLLDLPVSWVAAEGERPHIVQKWQSMAGFGQQMITLDIRSTGSEISKQDIKGLIDGGELRTLAPPGSYFISGGAQTVESLPGYWFDYSTTAERAGSKVYQIGRINTFFILDKAFSINCMTTVEWRKKAQADQDFPKIKALCPMVVNSVVLKDLY